MAIIIIPARFHSVRFPGKPLVLINNKPMIQWVYERVRQATGVTSVLVATDDERIYASVLSFGGQAVMTSANHKSGTDRIYEAALNCGHRDEVIINVQGDEPLIPVQLISQFVSFIENLPKDCGMATIAVESTDQSLLNNPNTVKVVLRENGYAQYFSRSGIPHGAEVFYKHIGIYGFQPGSLETFVNFPVSKLEKVEQLEQLRAIEYGLPIGVMICKEKFPHVSIDTPEDLITLESLLQNKTRSII